MTERRKPTIEHHRPFRRIKKSPTRGSKGTFQVVASKGDRDTGNLSVTGGGSFLMLSVLFLVLVLVVVLRR
ncbi:MAG TPA: hypothetical protein VKS00_08645 [Candidatus Acidoferrales bacterium]|nr:hypothetical protein [Candidatus Acidoferrales bacterium]